MFVSEADGGQSVANSTGLLFGRNDRWRLTELRTNQPVGLCCSPKRPFNVINGPLGACICTQMAAIDMIDARRRPRVHLAKERAACLLCAVWCAVCWRPNYSGHSGHATSSSALGAQIKVAKSIEAAAAAAGQSQVAR